MNRAQKLNRQIVKKNSGTIPGPEFRILSAAAIDSAAAFAGLNRLRNVPSADFGISFRLPHIESGIQLNESREGEIIDTKKQWPGREKLAIALESLKNEYRISEYRSSTGHCSAPIRF